MPMLRKVGIARKSVSKAELQGMVYAIAESIRRGDKQQTFPKDNQSQFNKSLIPKGYESLPHNTHYTYLANNHPVHLLLFFKAHIPEHRRHTKDGKTIIVHAHDDKRTAQQPHPETFIKAPDGSFDFGEITLEQADSMGGKAGKIRLQQGVHDDATGKGFGKAHIDREVRASQLSANGYDSTENLIFDVAKHKNAIYKGGGDTFILAKVNGKALIAFVKVKKGGDGIFYSIGSGLVSRDGYLKNKPLLWERAQTNQLKESPSAVTGKSNGPNKTIHQSEKNTSPKDLHKAFGTKPNTMILFFKKAA